MPVSEVHHIDCMEYMKHIPNKFFDLAIVDPPYGIGCDNPSLKPCTVKQKNGERIKVKQTKYSKKSWDKQIPTPEYFEELKRVSKHQIIFGANYFPAMQGGRIVWDKLNGESDQYGCEIAYQSFSDRTDIVYYMWSGMFQGIACSRNIHKALVQQGNKALNERRIHPTQKPVPLYAWLLREFAKEGDKIYDSHLGSGSHRIAAFKLGFDFYACENDEEHFADQELRFRHECLGETKLSNGQLIIQQSLF